MDTTRRVPSRTYQVARDPEHLLIEERAEALSAAGYPLPNDDPAMYAEQRLKRPRRLVQRKLMAFSNKLQLRKICEVREK